MGLRGLQILKFVQSIFTPSKNSSRKHCNKQKQASERLKNSVLSSNHVENHYQYNIKISKTLVPNLKNTEKNGKACIQSDLGKKNCFSEILNNCRLRRRRRRCNVRVMRNKKKRSKHIVQSPLWFSKDRTSIDTRLSKDANRVTVEGNRKIDVTAPNQASSLFKNHSFNLYSCKVEYENPFCKELSKAFSQNKSGSNFNNYRSIDESSSKTKCAYDNGMGHFNILNLPNSNSIAKSRNTVKPYLTRCGKCTKNLDEISVSDKSVSVTTLPVVRKINNPIMACAQVKALSHNQTKPTKHNCEKLSTHPKLQVGMIDVTAPECENLKFNQTDNKSAKKPFFAYFATKVFKNSCYTVNKKVRGRRKKSFKRKCSPKTTKSHESHHNPQMNNLGRTSKRRLGPPLMPHCNTKLTPSVDFSVWKPSEKCERKDFSCDLPAKHSFDIVPRDAIKKICKHATRTYSTRRRNRLRSRNSKRFAKSPTECYHMNQCECYCTLFKPHPQNHIGDGNFCCSYKECPKRELRSNYVGNSPSKTEAAVDSVPDSKTAKKRGQGMCKSLDCRYFINHRDKSRQKCTCLSKMMQEHQSPPQARRQSKQGSPGIGEKPLVSTEKDEKTLKEKTKSSPKMVAEISSHEKTKNKKLNASGTETSVKGVQCCPPKPILHNHKCQCKAHHICFCFGEGDKNNDDNDDKEGGGVRGGEEKGGGRGRGGGGGGRGGGRGEKGDTATGKKGGVAAGKKSVTGAGDKVVAAPGKKKAAESRKKEAKGPARTRAKDTGKKKGKVKANKRKVKAKKRKVKAKKRKEYFGKKGAKNRAKEIKKYKKGYAKFIKGAKKLHGSKRCRLLRLFEGKVRSKFCPRKTTAQKMGIKCCKCLKFVGRLFVQRCIEYYEHRKELKKKKTFFKRLYHFICFPLRKTKYAILAIFDLFNETNGYITKVDCDTLYIHALRDRPNFWVYRRWPKLYPYFLYYRKSFLRCMNILMIIMGAMMWIPIVMSCYLFLSLLRACLCN